MGPRQNARSAPRLSETRYAAHDASASALAEEAPREDTRRPSSVLDRAHTPPPPRQATPPEVRARSSGVSPQETLGALGAFSTRIDHIVKHSLCVARNADQFYEVLRKNLPVGDLRHDAVVEMRDMYEAVMRECRSLGDDTAGFTPFWRESSLSRPECNIAFSEYDAVPSADNRTHSMHAANLKLPHTSMELMPQFYLCFFAEVRDRDYKALFRSIDRIDFSRFCEQIPRGTEISFDLKFSAHKFYRATTENAPFHPNVELNAHVTMKRVEMYASEYTLYELSSVKLFYAPSERSVNAIHEVLRNGSAGATRTFA
jgi:hypothetical protein